MTPQYLLAGYSLNGTGGGGGSSATTLEVTVVVAANVSAGQLLYAIADGGANAGKFKMTDAATLDQGNARVIAKDAALSGASVTAYREGIVPVQFDAVPAVTDNGAQVYASTTTPGAASLTRPTAPGPKTIKPIGSLQGADGVASLCNVLLDWEAPSYLGA